MTTSELAIAAWWQCCLAKCEHLFDFSPLCCCLAKCVHVIKTGCRPLSLSLSPACWHTCTRALISSQVAIKSCNAAKTAQIPPSMPGLWLASPPQALPLTGPTPSCDSAQSAFLPAAEFFCKLFIQREARIGVSAKGRSYRTGDTEGICAKEVKVASISGQIFAKQRLTGSACQRSEPGVTFQILGPRKIVAASETKSWVLQILSLLLANISGALSSKYILCLRAESPCLCEYATPLVKVCFHQQM